MILVIRRLGLGNVDPPFSFSIVLTYIIPELFGSIFVSAGIYNEIILFIFYFFIFMIFCYEIILWGS